ncbi:MAG: hypothetical protein U0U70_13325 [Chitinophagaceae bacterium]
MAAEKKTGLRKDEVAYLFAIILGLAIGILVRRVRVGLMIGVVLCALIGFSTIIRFMRGNK